MPFPTFCWGLHPTLEDRVGEQQACEVVSGPQRSTLRRTSSVWTSELIAPPLPPLHSHGLQLTVQVRHPQLCPLGRTQRLTTSEFFPLTLPWGNTAIWPCPSLEVCEVSGLFYQAIQPLLSRHPLTMVPNGDCILHRQTRC